MAAPTYISDLVTIILDMSSTTGWTALGGGTAGMTAPKTDAFIQGSNCISKAAWSGAIKGMIYNSGAGQSISTPAAFFVWTYYMCPNALNTEALGGIQIIIGSSSSAYYHWYVKGNDTYTYGGWNCYAVDPSVTVSNTTSTPSGTLQYFGVLADVSASGPSKGNPLCIDAMRYGRAIHLTGGDSGNGYGTFSGLASQNDNISNRWGQFQSIDGGYLWKGLLSFGLSSKTTTYRARSSNVATITTSAAHGFLVGDTVTLSGLGGTGYNVTAVITAVGSTTTFSYANTGSNETSTADTGGTVNAPCDFRDSNRNISIQNTKKVVAGFNEIDIRNTSSRIDWTNIQITALGTVSKGKLTTTDDADVNFDTCTFTDMDTFVFKSNATVLSTTFRRCGLVTQGSGVFTTCKFESSTASASILVDDPNDVTYCTFVSDTSNHAIELTSACAGNSYNLTGHTFTGYATSDGTSGNEVIYNNSGGAVTLNVSGCNGTISIRNGSGASTTLVQNTVSATVTVKTSDGTAIENARVLVIAEAGGPMPNNVTVTITRSGSTATVSHSTHGLATNDKVQIKGATQLEYNGVFTITKIDNNSYSYTVSGTPATPATGTIKSTFVVLSGLTNSSGVITMSRTFSSDQPVSGKVRKSSASPYYKTANIIGTVDSTNGFDAVVQLIPDE